MSYRTTQKRVSTTTYTNRDQEKAVLSPYVTLTGPTADPAQAGPSEPNRGQHNDVETPQNDVNQSQDDDRDDSEVRGDGIRRRSAVESSLNKRRRLNNRLGDRELEPDHPKANRYTGLLPPTTGPMMEARRDLNVYDGTFNLIHGNQINHNNEGSGIHRLSKMIATDAIHNACERYPPPNVHQGTRTTILEVLKAWINDLDPEYRSFWLHGPTGSGKSAILQALAELLSSPKGPVAASFFFGKGQGKRGTGDYLFSTLAYQLAVNVNGLRPYVDAAMQRDPTLPTKSMEVQLCTLIIGPFQRLETLPSHIQTVIIDGLDECQGDKSQKAILQLIGDALTKHKLPLRFLIASRPEPHIRDGFDNPSLLPVSRRVMLHDDFQTQYDIEKYLQDGFADICLVKSHAMVHVKMPWPGKNMIDILTRHACGQFIYAATVLKFVAQKSTHPVKQLDIVLRPHPSRAKAFSELDCLYSQILFTHPDPDMLVRVLSTILAFESPQRAIFIEEILEMEKGEIPVVLEGLHSLLEGLDAYSSNSYIHIRHASFRDYLLDTSRSGVFSIDKTTLDGHLSTCIFSMTSNWIFKSLNATKSKPTDGSSYDPDLFHARYYISRNLATHLSNLDDCVGLNKVAAQFEQHILNRIEDASIQAVPFEILYSLIEPLSEVIPFVKERTICEELLKVRKKYVATLHICYKSVLSSGEQDTLLASLQGLGAIKMFLSFDTLESICRLEGRDLSRILGRFMDSSPRDSLRVRLSPHVIEFLTNKESAGVYYYDPIVSHFALCHNIISILFPPSWQDISQSVVNNFRHFDLSQFFRYHLDAPYNDNTPDVQHTVGFLDHLDRIDYYDPKWPLLRSGDVHRIWHIWAAIKEVLLWLLKRKQNLRDTLANRYTQLFDKILHQVLCLLSAETEFGGSIHLVTIREPFRSSEGRMSGMLATECFSMARQNIRSDQLVEAPTLGSKIPVRFSDDILLLDFHTFELEKYFTDMERSGNFYIASSDYFNQLLNMHVARYLAGHSILDYLQTRKYYNLVTACVSYLVHAQPISKELYANLQPISAQRLFPSPELRTRVLQLLKASPHTPLDLYNAWKR